MIKDNETSNIFNSDNQAEPETPASLKFNFKFLSMKSHHLSHTHDRVP